MLQSPVPNVSVASAMASSVSELVTVSVTAAVGTVVSETMTVSAPPPSSVDTRPGRREMFGMSSSMLIPEIVAVRPW